VKEIQVTMTELRQNLGSLINQAAFGNALIVLISHGKPKAAIVGADELRQLRTSASSQDKPYLSLLATADRLRERITLWQKEQNSEPEDSVETLAQLREERLSEFADLH
jgi:prevent-host-death family protein